MRTAIVYYSMLGNTEYVLVTNTNLLISASGYKEALIKAKKNASDGHISILVSTETKTDKRYGYVDEKTQVRKIFTCGLSG